MFRVTCALAVLVLLSGCAQPQAPTPGPEPEQAVQPSVTAADPVPLIEAAPPVESTPTAAPGTADGTEQPTDPEGDQAGEDGDESAAADGSTSSDSGDGEDAERDAAGPPASTSEPIVLLSVGDRTGDHGPEGPAWADLTAVEFVELGNDLRVTLQFAGALPATPAEGEVPLIGVNIGEGEDGYQLFVEGGGQSWAAYLQTPQGFVQYPGTFQLGGRSIVLQVPFNAVGSPTRAPVRVFVEWSRKRLLLNATSEDRLDGEPHTFDRNP
jgi:hypothetical protein